MRPEGGGVRVVVGRGGRVELVVARFFPVHEGNN